MTKEYRFDYIREQVMRWHHDILRTCTVEDLKSCASVTFPWIMPDEYVPSHDRYGDVVEDYSYWAAQRDAYCEKLFKEISANRSWYDNLEAKWGRTVIDLNMLMSYKFSTICSVILICIVDWFKHLKKKILKLWNR